MNDWSINLLNYSFFYPAYLWLFLFLPLVIYFLFRNNRGKGSDFFVSTQSTLLNKTTHYLIQVFRYFLDLLVVLVFSLIILILAKPFKWEDLNELYNENDWGIDIVMAVDVSLSMQAKDFSPNRLEAAKQVMINFISQRRGDRIGIVGYAGEAYTVCSPTTNYDLLISRLSDLSGENIDQGTAIGTGLGTSVINLQKDSTNSKVIILLTDGMNNSGELSPIAAAELARDENICVYTIGVGTNGEALTPVSTSFGISFAYQKVEIDEETLEEIASITNGKYFRANDEKMLEEIYSVIDQLEKSKVENQGDIELEPTSPSAFLNWLLVCAGILFFSKLYFFPLKIE